MNLPVVLAHGALGPFDEIIFLGVAVVFLVLMGVSWFASRNAELEEEPTTETPAAPTASEAQDRFRLE